MKTEQRDHVPATQRLYYAEIRMWMDGSNPLTDPPDEVGGVIQTKHGGENDGKIDVEATAQFGAKMLRIHGHGECACQLTAAHGSATRFTFMSDDGKYPVSGNGKVQWLSDRQEAIKQAKSWGFNILVEMDDQGHRLGMVNLIKSD